MKKKELGYKYEDIAKNFLIKKGFQILDTNFTIRGGEIDIIAKKGNIVSFVEVKGVSKYTDFQDYINFYKMKALQKTANYRINQNDTEGILEYRFDLIFVQDMEIVDFIEGFIT